jgi:hypothetical protein
MKVRGNRILYRWVIVLSSIFLLVLVITISLPSYLEREIHSAISTHNGKVSSVEVSLFSRSVQIKNLEWSSPSDSLNSQPHFLKLNTLAVKGISVYRLLVHKIIHVNEILFDSGKVQYNANIHRSSQVLTSKYTLDCNSINMNNVEVQIMTDTIVSFSALLDLHLTEVVVGFDSTHTVQYSVKKSDGIARKMNFSRHEGMYGGTVKQLSFNTQEQKIIIDSILLIPNFSKYKFAQYLGEQAGRVNISIPQLLLEGVEFDKLIDSTFIASKIVFQSFDLFSFKDKRIPFLRDYNIPLPMESFLNLSWKVKIDSILIKKSRITIEEFPEKGDERTTIIFTDVNASFTGLNNRVTKNEPAYALLHTSGLLMGTGKIQAVLKFPLDSTSSYTAKGEISKFSLVKLNPVFIPIANIRIESGYLNSLTFDFTYTEFQSKGKLDLDYEDLRLLGLNKSNAKTHELKTFLISLVIKKNRDQSGRNAKAGGIIDIERDRKRLIFNVWWKSILDGLRSSILGRKKKNTNKKR